MQQTMIKPPLCNFCKPARQENRFLAKNLYRRIKRQISMLKRHQAVTQKTEGNGFRQLVKVLYPHLLRKSQDCQHQTHIDSFCNLLKIDSQVLDQACERVANAIAETNYHLELVANQIKNVSDSLALKRIEVELDSDDSHPSQPKGKKKAQFGAERQVNASHTRKPAQALVNSSEQPANYSLYPISGSQPSISPLSQQNGNQFAFILPYPFFPNGYSIQ